MSHERHLQMRGHHKCAWRAGRRSGVVDHQHGAQVRRLGQEHTRPVVDDEGSQKVPRSAHAVSPQARDHLAGQKALQLHHHNAIHRDGERSRSPASTQSVQHFSTPNEHLFSRSLPSLRDQRMSYPKDAGHPRWGLVGE